VALAYHQNGLALSLQSVVESHAALLMRHSNLVPNHVFAATLDHFAGMNPRCQRYVINKIHQLNTLLQDAVNSGVKLTSDKRLTWFAIARLGMVPCADGFDQIKGSDFVEIYNTDGIQIFRNLEFYKLISYSIAEITLYPWYKLYGRDEVFSGQIRSEAFVKAFDGRRETFRPAIDDHESVELMSTDQRQFHIAPGVISPLFNKMGRPVAFLATSQRQRIVGGQLS